MKILVCDDESMIRKGIKAMLENHFHGVDITLCKNGAEALEAASSQEYDVILTDIQMPEMDGLTFIQKLHAMQTETAIVVISGYDSFDYAVQALRFGVREYLLKPVDRHKLYETIETILQEKEANYDVEKELIPKLKVQLLTKNTDVYLHKYSHLHFLKESFYVAVCKGMKEELPCTEDVFAFEGINEEIVVLMKHPISELTQRDAEVIGVSTKQVGYDRITDGYREALYAAESQFFYSHQKVFCYVEPKRESDIPFSCIEKIIRYIGTNRDEEMLSLIDEIIAYEKLVALPLSYTKTLHQTLLQIVTEKVVVPYKLKESLVTFEQIEAYGDYEKWKTQWKKILQTYSKEIYKKTGVQYYISQSLKYIEEHYNEDITLAMVSNHVSLNYSYLSALFKEHVGQSFGNYVRFLRMEKAKEYLKEGHLKVYEVAESVGYQDAKQFTKTFRKITGVSPQEYREKYIILQEGSL